MYGSGDGPNLAIAPVQLGSMGETACAQTTEPIADAQPLEAEGWTFALDGVKLTVNGTWQGEQEPTGDFSLVLQSEDQARYYPMTRYANQGDAGVSVALSGWVSRQLPAGRYQILVVLDGVAYDTGRSIEA